MYRNIGSARMLPPPPSRPSTNPTLPPIPVMASPPELRAASDDEKSTDARSGGSCMHGAFARDARDRPLT
eukprot:441110-Rhodomonas_salina.3